MAPIMIEDGWHTHARRQIMIQTGETKADLPTTDIEAGSVAYNAALTLIYQFDGEEWVRVGEDEEEEEEE